MGLITFLTVFYIILIILDLTPIYLKKHWKLFWIYLIMVTVSYIIQVLLILDVKLPSPVDPIERIVVSIFGL